MWQSIFLDNSPSLYDEYNTFTQNFFAYNDVGVMGLPSVQRNIFQNNTFLENYQQVSVQGRGNLLGNLWNQDGIGNYWSNYVGYDRDGDGVGDVPYRAEKLFESLTDSEPVLRLFATAPPARPLTLLLRHFHPCARIPKSLMKRR
jgi:nitrous oxidase accessory protein